MCSVVHLHFFSLQIQFACLPLCRRYRMGFRSIFRIYTWVAEWKVHDVACQRHEKISFCKHILFTWVMQFFSHVKCVSFVFVVIHSSFRVYQQQHQRNNIRKYLAPFSVSYDILWSFVLGETTYLHLPIYHHHHIDYFADRNGSIRFILSVYNVDIAL